MKKRIYIFASLIILFSSSVYPEGQKIIINSAQYTEYKKVLSSPLTEEPDKKNKPEKKELEEADSDNNKKDEDKKNSEPLKDELVIFTGSVSISVSDGSSTSTINADKIIHNKTRETLTAFGNVFYERKIGSSSGESFKGEYLLFNIKKLEGVFLDGILEQAETKKGKDPFRIHTEVAGKNGRYNTGTIPTDKKPFAKAISFPGKSQIRLARIDQRGSSSLLVVKRASLKAMAPLSFLPATSV